MTCPYSAWPERDVGSDPQEMGRQLLDAEHQYIIVLVQKPSHHFLKN